MWYEVIFYTEEVRIAKLVFLTLKWWEVYRRTGSLDGAVAGRYAHIPVSLF